MVGLSHIARLLSLLYILLYLAARGSLKFAGTAGRKFFNQRWQLTGIEKRKLKYG
jgi:hypothetical protein